MWGNMMMPQMGGMNMMQPANGMNMMNGWMQPQGAQGGGQSAGLNRVTGAEGARAFPTPPNTVVALFDDTRDVFYVKATDSGGFPTMRAYAFVPLEEAQAPAAPAVPTAPAAMSRQEIEEMVRSEVERYGKQFISAGQTTERQREQPKPVSGGGTAQTDAGRAES